MLDASCSPGHIKSNFLPCSAPPLWTLWSLLCATFHHGCWLKGAMTKVKWMWASLLATSVKMSDVKGLGHSQIHTNQYGLITHTSICICTYVYISGVYTVYIYTYISGKWNSHIYWIRNSKMQLLRLWTMVDPSMRIFRKQRITAAQLGAKKTSKVDFFQPKNTKRPIWVILRW